MNFARIFWVQLAPNDGCR